MDSGPQRTPTKHTDQGARPHRERHGPGRDRSPRSL